MEKNTQGIKVAKKDEIVFIKINGEGCLDNSLQLKDFLRQMLAKGFKDFILCLENCPYMDSTFLGVLVGVSLRLKEKFDTKLRLSGINKFNLNLLKTLDIANLFNISRKKINFTAERKALEKNEGVSILQKAKHIKKAHYNLMKTSRVCQIQFIGIHELLSKEIKKLQQTPHKRQSCSAD